MKKAAYFEPTKPVVSEPFEAWKVASNGQSNGKYIATNEDESVSVKAFDKTGLS
jgi:hypothetical protein